MFLKSDYSDTGSGLPWEVRQYYLKDRGWSRSEVLRLLEREEEEANARKEHAEPKEDAHKEDAHKEGAHAKNHPEK